MTKTIIDRINRLRNELRKSGITACVIPSNDPHLSEYVAEHWKARSYFSGFSGSAGTLVITKDKACLWTDSRYTLQAKKELQGSEISCFITGEMGSPSYCQWLIENTKKNTVISMQDSIFSIDEIVSIENEFSSNNITLDTKTDIISKTWTDRPSLPQEKIFIHDTIYSGESFSQKFKKIQLILKENNADLLILNMLDEIAWLFNIRGRDILHNPIAISFAIIENETATLFISEKKLDDETKSYFQRNKISLKDYSSFYTAISKINNKTILADNKTINYAIFNQIKSENKILFSSSPISKLKSIKNEIQKKGIFSAMEKDGVALTRFFMWLEDSLSSKSKITEISLAEKLKEFRSQQNLYYGESFASIVAFQEHGAIVHYNASPETNKTIENDGFLLIDSGGQYLDGTTDITRTTRIGHINSTQKRNFTLVLKGHIALATATFPIGTYGFELDRLARTPLIKEGLNYGHGTGHGVGHFLCVHEGPQSIRSDRNKIALEKGMVISNEPGIYISNEYGIRTENLLFVEDVKNAENERNLHFETLTLFPYDTTAIDFSLMLENEIDWLNNYHQKVYERISPYLSSNAKKWLQTKCKKIQTSHS